MVKFFLICGVALATPAYAQASASGGAQQVAAVPAVPPATGGQIGQAPRNSAMRQAEGGRVSAQASAGAGSTPTNAMTLTLAGAASSQSQSGTQDRPDNGTRQPSATSPSAGGAEPGSRQGPAYDATGIIRQGGSAGGGSQP